MNKYINIIKQSNSWIEGSAVLQLQNALNLEYMIAGAGLPDLHPGKGYPVGASFISKDNFIYPYLIGSDIGCGMRLDLYNNINSSKINLNKLLKQYKNLENINIYNKNNISEEFGFIGGGNHFQEILKINFIEEKNIEKYNINKNATFVLTHSGSRGFGHQIAQNYINKNSNLPVNINDELGQWYIQKHNKAIIWAKENRRALSLKSQDILNEENINLLDIYHNYVEKFNDLNNDFSDFDNLWIHRKGAASSYSDLAIIPGSRGDFSYLVKPIAKKDSLYSIAHGAGRKWQRSNCKCMLEDKFSVKDLQKTKLGSFVICEDKDLLYEEAPQAYKKISSVIEDCLYFDIIEVIAILQPILTYKTVK